MKSIQDIEKEFVEKGADLEHDRWARWQKYMFSLCEKLETGSMIIPVEFVERWQRQIDTPYADLSEQEKESDREQVRPYLPILQEKIKELLIGLKEEERDNPIPPIKGASEFQYNSGYNQAVRKHNAKINKLLK